MSKLYIKIFHYKLNLLTLTEVYEFRKDTLWILLVTGRVYYRISRPSDFLE